MTTGELHDKMVLVGADLMGRALAALERGSLSFTPQTEEGVTYAKKIEKAEARIDWSKPASRLHHIHGMSPFPGAWIELESVAACASEDPALEVVRLGVPGTVLPDTHHRLRQGAVRIVQVQRAGKAPMEAANFLRGAGPLPEQASA